ncbi:hypothetical protein CVT25_012843, partial [Psilocybe cyanescens]
LPSTLDEWKTLTAERYVAVWEELRPLIEQHGFRLWRTGFGIQVWEFEFPEWDNFLFLTSHKGQNASMVNWNHFRTHSKPIRHAARMNDVRDVVLRVITASGEGQTHLRILRRLSAPPDFLLSSNHILPILYQIIFEDIVILAVPKVIFNFCEIFDPYYSNSVEDALYMVLQAFEVGHFSIYIFEDLCTFDQGVAYLHRNLIGHQYLITSQQDLFLNNFVVEWMPLSMEERTSITRPLDSLESERLCPKFPLSMDNYTRHVAPEITAMQPYCPFRLDMWQLGKDLQVTMPTNLVEIVQLWRALCEPAPQDRMTADDAFKTLDAYLRKTPSIELHRELLPPSYELQITYDEHGHLASAISVPIYDS